MILFGTNSFNSTVGEGQFYCPRCGAGRGYRQIAVKQWFTLYFIPVIPMGTRGEYVECTSCAGTYGVEVLNYDPEAERAQVVADMRRVAALALGESSRLNDANVEQLCLAFEQAGGAHCLPQEIHQDWQMAREANANLQNFAANRVADLNDKGRVLLIQLIIHGMRGTGELDEQCNGVIDRLAGAINVGPNAVAQLKSPEYRLLD